MLQAADQFVEQERNIIGALAQGWHLDGKHVDAIVQILPKGAGIDHGFQILVGGGEDSHVGMNSARATDTLITMLLQYPQQLDLHGQWHVANFIEEQRATFRQLETPDASGNGPGKSALFMTEEFALQELRRDGATVDRDEGLAGTAGIHVQIARDYFLAGARLASDQHSHFLVGDLPHNLTDALHLGTGAHQTAEHVVITHPPDIPEAVVMLMVNLRFVQGIKERLIGQRQRQGCRDVSAQFSGQIAESLFCPEQYQRDTRLPAPHFGDELREQLIRVSSDHCKADTFR